MIVRIVFIGLLLMTFLNATDIDKIAENFISYQSQSHTVLSKEILSENNKEVGFLYHLSPSGYIIIPKELIASPIKAFSFQTNFYDLPKPYQTFLLKELNDYVTYAESRILAKALTPSEIQERWSFLENYVTPTQDSRALKSYIPDTFLIKSTWNQTYPYNKIFPKVGDTSTVTGCVQTAMAQVMKYHKYPQRGSGVYTRNAAISDASGNTAYTTSLKAVLNRYYNWDIMPDIITSEVKEYQTDEISYLMRDLAIINDADIGVSATSTPASADMLVKSFGYSNTLSYTSTDYTDRTAFLNILKNQIDQEMPTLFSMPGHMVVADGYKGDFSGHYIHLNMGWGGAYNNFYSLDASAITAGSNVFSTSSLDLIYNIKPCTTAANDCSANLEINDKATGNVLQGSFLNQSDIDSYGLYLNGNTSFDINAGLYVNLYNSKKELISTFKSTSGAISLLPDFYTLEVSLSSDTTNYYYEYSSGNSTYQITVSTQPLTSSELNTINASLFHAPQIDMELKDRLVTGEEIIRINAYDEDEKDTPTFSAYANEYFDVNFTNNLLHVKPKVQNAMSDIVVQVKSPDGVAEKTFKVVSVAEPLLFGKQFTMSGIFESKADFNKHKAILQGTCTVSGNRGYSNQAFYTSLLSQSSVALTTMVDVAFTTPSLSLGQYLIGASLSENPSTGYGSSFAYTAWSTYNNYTLTVSCPDANGTIESIIPLLGTLLYKPTVIDMTYPAMPIAQGWQLLSFPVVATLNKDTLKTTFAQSDILWKYFNTQWYALGINSNIQAVLDTHAIPAIETLGNEEGFWIYTSQNDYNATLSSMTSFDVNITNKLGTNASKWQLLGNGQEKSTQPLLEQNPSVKALWSFENNQWKVISNDFNLTTIGKLPILKKGQGFWLEKR